MVLARFKALSCMKPKAASATLRSLGPSGNENGETAALRDLTRLYLKSLETQRAKDALLAVAAHELRHLCM